ncbi:glycosyltransferase family 2 protein [Coraliomargarita akajimensis]|uniref:Glycosyl transferase family 2 n=1 Tax=Coraliomargarita akajimensis (strain DSM 45221 / IAM 15411 / JCM 23193 / KCTC 12865 / 04OKA010-24) TaxID=583355 RepID=D5EP58_CORAD|nr:glycosyltransferase family 2 protein [Coraliomargarita akajimensis]ADE55568.1 glycosyl transferase family 2 [Coraliomargarita akajimensis DSM 45221]
MKPTLSIVAPVYNEAEGVREFIDAVVSAVRPLAIDWELVLVNDGSKDATLSIVQEYQADVPELVWVNLSRNFGHQAAVTAAIDHALGDAVVVMDADMQDPPSLIPELLSAWKEGAEVVFARRVDRSETGLRRIGFDLFHKCFRFAIDFPIPPNVGVFSLLDRVAVDHLKGLNERNRFLPGLYSWVGFTQAFVDYTRQDRSEGEPKQTFKALVKYAIDGVLSFSYKPIRLLGALGLLTATSAFLIAIFFTMKRLLGFEVAFTGFTTLVILISLLGGSILVAIALVGEYVARIYDEVKQRPAYIVRETSRDD